MMDATGSHATETAEIMKDVVVKSPFDVQNYSLIQLKNGLQVLLVQDPRIKENRNTAAAAMTVGVGSLDSPENFQGLAHLLEHMFFAESQNFSKNEALEHYVQTHGGSTMASTDFEHSCFGFEINGEFFKSALERFADGLILPTFSKDNLKAELNAVHSEFYEKQNDTPFILSQFRCHSSNEGHRYNKVFSLGNKKSLVKEGEGGSDDLYNQLLEFYHSKYYGKVMKLVIVGGEPIEILQGWVENLFNSVKKCVVKKFPKHPFGFKLRLNPVWARQQQQLQEKKIKEQLKAKNRKGRLPKKPSIWKSGVLCRIKDPEDALIVSWTLPCLYKKYKYQPERYVSHFFNQYDEGSLHSLLKNLGWISNVEASVGNGVFKTSAAHVFAINIYLSSSGLHEIFKIIDLIYQYIKLIQDDPPKWIYEEVRRIEEIEFNLGLEKTGLENAKKFSENLLFYRAKHVTYADHLPNKWDEDLMKKVLSYFVPNNMRVEVVSDTFKWKSEDTKHTKHVPWFGTTYSIQDIDANKIKSWKTSKVNESLKIPDRNEFLKETTAFDGVGVPSQDPSSKSILPTCILQENGIEFWYKRNSSRVHSIVLYLGIQFKQLTSNRAKHWALSQFWINMLEDKLLGVMTKARQAQIDTKLRFVDGRLELKIVSNNRMTLNLLSKILKEVNTFLPVDDPRYESVKQDTMRSIGDEHLLLEHELQDLIFKRDKLLCHLQDLSFKDMIDFIQETRSEVFIQGICNGNVEREDVNEICKTIKECFQQQQEVPVSDRYVDKVICLPPKKKSLITTYSDNFTGSNSFIRAYFQIGKNLFESLNLIASLNLFSLIIEKHFFDEMRSKECFGYTAYCSTKLIHNVWGYEFYVITCDSKMRRLQHCFEKFIDNLEKFFIDLDDEVFENYKISLTRTLSMDLSIQKETEDFWKAIIKYSGRFNTNLMVAGLLKDIKKEDLVDFYKTFFQISSESCRRLMYVHQNSARVYKNEDSSDDSVENENEDSGDESNEDNEYFHGTMKDPEWW